MMDGLVNHAHQDMYLVTEEINVSQLLALDLMRLLEVLNNATLVLHAQLAGNQMQCRENVFELSQNALVLKSTHQLTHTNVLNVPTTKLLPMEILNVLMLPVMLLTKFLVLHHHAMPANLAHQD